MYNKIFTLLLAAITLTSCIDSRDLSKNIVVAHISSNPDGLHPYNDNSVMRSFIFEHTQKSLVKLDLKTLNYFPSLVKTLPEISEDGLLYHYELRDDVRWDDGSELTAKDIEFTVKLQICPLTDNANVRGNYTSVIKDIILYPNEPKKFTMVAFGKNVTNANIFSEVYIQQKSHWDPDGILDDLTFEEIHNPNFK